MKNRALCVSTLGVAAVLSIACASTTGPQPAGVPVAGEHHAGKFVWFDLLTDDAAAAKTFYAAMFGWQYEPWPGFDRYAFIKSGDETIGGILTLKPHEGQKISQWFGYVSVDDVDAAVGQFEARGGKLWRGPVDIPGRGRAALVADPQGGFVALLRSEKGDPPDGRQPAMNRWMWVDYVANDTVQASAFYAELFGYKAEVAERVGNREYYLFKQGDRLRAGMFKNPWPKVRPNWLPYIRVADPAELVEKTRQLGGIVVVEPRADLRNGSTAVVLDPTGAGVVLQKFSY
jgi:uncharacterized protein